MFAAAIGVASLAVGTASAIGSASTAAANSKASAAYQAWQFRTQIEDRDRAIDYAQEVFKQDLSFAYDTLDYQQNEFARQTRTLDRNRTAIQQNTDWSIGGILMRQLEEDMASTLQELGIGKQAGQQRATAQVSASARGVEGNSVDAIINDVSRQEGEAMTVAALNRSATSRSLTRQVIEARTAGTQQLMGQQAQTYAPSTPIRVMGPMGAISGGAPVAQQSPLTAIAGIGNAVTGAFNTYNTLTKQDASTTFNQATGWLRSTFGIGGT